jgi:hypothetical protein
MLSFVDRAPLRLKPSRKCANRGYCGRYGVPHCLVNALAGAFVGRPFHPRNLRFPGNCFFTREKTRKPHGKGLPFRAFCGSVRFNQRCPVRDISGAALCLSRALGEKRTTIPE